MIHFHRVQECSKKITEKTHMLDLLESFLFNLQMNVSRLYHECIINVSYYILNMTDSITKTATKDNTNWDIVLSTNLCQWMTNELGLYHQHIM